MKWKKLIILGDSNTQYGFGEDSKWVSYLSNSLQRKCDIINRGFSGYNTDNIKSFLPDILQDFDADSVCGVILMLGSNDSTKSSNKIQHVPLERFKANLHYIIDYLIEFFNSREKIILISPPRICDSKWREISLEKFEECTHSDSLVVNYAHISIEVAKEKNISFLDLNKLMHDYGEKFEELLVDGLHFSPKGGQFLFENLLPLFNKQIGDNLKFQLPYWRDIAPN